MPHEKKGILQLNKVVSVMRELLLIYKYYTTALLNRTIITELVTTLINYLQWLLTNHSQKNKTSELLAGDMAGLYCKQVQ